MTRLIDSTEYWINDLFKELVLSPISEKYRCERLEKVVYESIKTSIESYHRNETKRFNEEALPMLISRYKFHRTLDQIGLEFNVTGARAQEVIRKDLRILRHPNSRKRIVGAMRKEFRL